MVLLLVLQAKLQQFGHGIQAGQVQYRLSLDILDNRVHWIGDALLNDFYGAVFIAALTAVQQLRVGVGGWRCHCLRETLQAAGRPREHGFEAVP